MDRVIKYSLSLNRLHCYLADEGGDDEVFIKFNGEKIWPENKYKKMSSSSENLGIEIKVEKGSVNKFEIWDYDYLSANDLLGEISITADSMGGPYTTDMIRKGKGKSKYSIEWSLH